ncbi:MAG: DUF998 domain-containing protein [Desulfobacteraceae bacterium]|nr:MAG: DUF998 domain-containing protein [Desulfobacteraceae bacterium]
MTLQLKITGKGTERAILFTAWPALILTPVALFIGHLGTHSLSWIQNQVSTYAVQAPHDHWITASMLLSALVLICIGLLFPAHPLYGQNFWSRMTALVLGAGAAGLLIIAGFEETAPNLKRLQAAGFNAVRQQSFHKAARFFFVVGNRFRMLALFTDKIVPILCKTNP